MVLHALGDEPPPHAARDGAADGVPHVVLLGREGGQHDERHDQSKHRSACCTVFDGGPAVHQAGPGG